MLVYFIVKITKKQKEEIKMPKINRKNIDAIFSYDLIEVRTGERVTYFFINHKSKNAYYFEICLN